MDHIFSLIDELVKGDSHAQRELAATRLRGVLSGVLNQAPEPPPEPERESTETDEAAAKRHAAMDAERASTVLVGIPANVPVTDTAMTIPIPDQSLTHPKT